MANVWLPSNGLAFFVVLGEAMSETRAVDIPQTASFHRQPNLDHKSVHTVSSAPQLKLQTIRLNRDTQMTESGTVKTPHGRRAEPRAGLAASVCGTLLFSPGRPRSQGTAHRPSGAAPRARRPAKPRLRPGARGLSGRCSEAPAPEDHDGVRRGAKRGAVPTSRRWSRPRGLQELPSLLLRRGKNCLKAA